MKQVLSIATSDSGAGAGIQADLKTFAAHKVYGLTVLSAITAQNTLRVGHLEFLSPQSVLAQLECVFEDFEIEALKLGLLGNEENTMVIYNFLKEKKIPIIIDPVMVSTSGHVFIEKEAIEALKKLFTLATVITPNISEAAFLTGLTINNKNEMLKAAEKLMALGSKWVLLKGGHLKGDTKDDLLFNGEKEIWFSLKTVETKNSHGTGCTLSAAICSNLALGCTITQAVEQAKEYVSLGLQNSLNVGKGSGPLNHFHSFYKVK